MDGRQGEYVDALRQFFRDRPEPVRRRDLVEYLRSALPHHADDIDLRPGSSKTPTWKHDVDWALQKLKTEGMITNYGYGFWTAE